MPYYRKIFYLLLFIGLVVLAYNKLSYHKADFYCYPLDESLEIHIIKDKKIGNKVKAQVTIVNQSDKKQVFAEHLLKCGLDESDASGTINLPIPLSQVDTLWPDDTLLKNLYFTFEEESIINIDSIYYFYRHDKKQ